MIRVRNARRFRALVAADTAMAEDLMHEAVLAAVLELGQNIVVGGVAAPGTPVDTGRARGAWMLTENAPSETAPVNGEDKAGGGVIMRAQASLARWKLGTKLFWANNVVYIVALEFGHSKAQAPFGMVRLACKAWPGYVTKAVAAVKAYRAR